jgi:methylthioribulose-1-phosphate dehydratase
MPSESSLQRAAATIAQTGRSIYSKAWVPATSGNFSMRLDDDKLAITVSGTDKGRLSEADIMSINLDGQSASAKKSSAETGLHLQLYRRDPSIGAVLHTHSVNATVCSQLVADELKFEGLELLKAFDGITSHESSFSVPVFDNTQDIEALAIQVERYMQSSSQGHGYLIRGHGLYTWGATMSDCMRHLEALEYLLEYYLISNGVVKR